MTQLIFLVVAIEIVFSFITGLLFVPTITTMIKMFFYEKVAGKIIDKDIQRIDTTDASGMFVHYKYEYHYKKKKYQIEDKGYGYNKKLEVGDTTDIYIKKGQPEKYIYPNMVRDRYTLLILSLSGIIPLLIILISIFHSY